MSHAAATDADRDRLSTWMITLVLFFCAWAMK
eukprot:CAMPEP_0167808484 /NCGR_PEP_ID=MMETSP0111_2-20121227/23221_1 /TAXON_ID=91324 /ORGANISM="Lotharella globosa, Strain CCCM811" /LENGTH=31 /DNA_ID= /DNA_START= /DNA_END= /DNA_ORIENTATION=